MIDIPTFLISCFFFFLIGLISGLMIKSAKEEILATPSGAESEEGNPVLFVGSETFEQKFKRAETVDDVLEK